MRSEHSGPALCSVRRHAAGEMTASIRTVPLIHRSYKLCKCNENTCYSLAPLDMR